MAKERLINTKFWNDTWIRKLNSLDRYLFLYLLTNEHTNISGIYELPIETIAYESGIDENDLKKSMFLRLEPKVYHNTGWIILINFLKYQRITSNDVVKGIIREICTAPKEVIKYAKDRGYGDGLGMVWDGVGYLTKLNLTKLTVEEMPIQQPFSNSEALVKLKESPKIIDKILWLYWSKKGLKFENSKQLSSEYQRSCKTAKKISESGYTGEQIAKAMNYCKNKYSDVDWKLETVLKTLPIVIKQDD